jgi:hypothetical protein
MEICCGDEYRGCEIGIKCFFKFFGGNLLERSAWFWGDVERGGGVCRQ